MRLTSLARLAPLALLMAGVAPALAEERSPAPLVQIPPAYPPDLSNHNLDGKVLVRFDLADDGAVTNLRVVDSSPGLVFEREALEAARAWRYLPSGADLPGTRRRDVRVWVAFRLRDKDDTRFQPVFDIPCDKAPLRLAGAERSECEALPGTVGIAADLPGRARLRLRASLADEATVRNWLKPVAALARGRVGELGGDALAGLPDTLQAFAFTRPEAELGLAHCVWFARMQPHMPAQGIHSGQVGSLCAAEPVDAGKLQSVLAQVTSEPPSDFAAAVAKARRAKEPLPKWPKLDGPLPVVVPAELEALSLSVHGNFAVEANPDGQVTGVTTVATIPALLFDDMLRDGLARARFKPAGEGQAVLSGFPFIYVNLSQAAPDGWGRRTMSNDCRTAAFDLPQGNRLRCTGIGPLHLVSGGGMDGYWELLLDRVLTAKAAHADARTLVEAVRATPAGQAAGLGEVRAKDDVAWSRFARNGRVCLWMARVTAVGDGQNRAYGTVCTVGTAEVDVDGAVEAIRGLIPGRG
ncbi:energy transducer TonB [Aerophototrophica crusticola]|uniref:Protein TonB n=1 Tax=Aerophototrophica crusticola TaxID=1709002 RepID=A0A858R4B3_9PROT|nr:energy transducer TonB [Rhodospirillaceae bacterium B3]